MKSKFLLILVIFLFICLNPLFPQVLEWEKCLGGSSEERAWSLIKTANNGFIIFGWSSSTDGDVTGNHGEGDYWVVKLDSTGRIEWQKSLGGSSPDEAKSIIQTTKNGFAAAGMSSSIDGDVSDNHGEQDYWVVKLDSLAGIEWQKSLGGSSMDLANAIIQTMDNGFAVAGTSISTDGDITGNHGGGDYWVVKLDSTGEIEWQKSLGGSKSEGAYSIIQTTDNGFVVAGGSNSTDGDVTGNHGGHDCWIVKLDNTGEIEWQKSFGGSSIDRAYSIIQTADNGFAVAGRSYSTDGDVTGNNGDSDSWIFKLDNTGLIEWQKNFGGSSMDLAYSIIQTMDNGFAITGMSRSNDGDITDNHGEEDYWVVKLDSTGGIEWQKSFGGSSTEEAWSIIQTKDNDFAVAGTSTSTDGDVTGYHGMVDYWVVKIRNKVSTPMISILSGMYQKSFKIAIENKNLNDPIFRYTLNGDNPDISSPVYLDSIVIDSSSVVKAIAYKASMEPSDIAFANYELKLPDPIFDPLESEYNIPQKISLSISVPNVEIYYTLDGSTPTQSSFLYTEPISVDHSLTLKCVGFKSGWTQSEIASGEYIISEQSISIKLIFDEIWYDTDFDGYKKNRISASESSISYGMIESYIWTLGSDTIARIADPLIELSTGNNIIFLTCISDRGYSKQDSIEISVYASKLQTLGGIYSAVSQLDNNRFFISSTDDKIYQFDSTGTVNWTILTGGEIQSTNCIGSKDNILVGSSDSRLYSFDENGNPNWDKAMGGLILSSPSFGPSKNVYLGISTGRLFSINESGTINWNFQTGGAIISSPVISQEEEIFFGSSDGNIYAVNSLGAEIWSYQTGDSVLSSAAIGIDSSIVIGSNDGYLYKIYFEGNLLWKFKTDGRITGSPVIGSEGVVYFGSGDGYIYSLTSKGSEIWRYETGAPINGSPSLDISENILIGNDQGKLISINRSGKLNWYLQTSKSFIAPPLITNSNLVYIGNTDGNVYIMKNRPETISKTSLSNHFEWPTFKGNNQRTGFNGEIISNLSQVNSKTPKEYVIFQNYPNPYNPFTKIRFGLPKAGKVQISVFNILGQRLKTLIDKYVQAGYHEIHFDGSILANGIYMYMMEADGFRQVRKMVLLK